VTTATPRGTDWVFGQQIRQARTSLWLSVSAAADLLEVSAPTLEAWESGVLAPDDEELWRLGDVYGRPVSYFMAPTSTPPAHQDFRVQRPTDPRDELAMRRTVVARFEELCRVQAAIEGLLEVESLTRRFASLKEESLAQADGPTLALWLRGVWGAGTEPLRDIRSLIESVGVRVFTVDVPVEGFAGTSWWHDEFGPAMLLNRKDPATRRNFTAAHELGHLLRGSQQVLCGFLTPDTLEERFANQFAAALLMPPEAVDQKVDEARQREDFGGWHTKDAALARLAYYFGVSQEAVSWRLENLQHLPDGFTATRRALWAARFYRGRRGPRWQHRLADLGSRHVELARRAYREGALSLSALAAALQLEVEDAYELALLEHQPGS
jgi:Zn-dependent peptidase ImmA (M78 family)/transcriptional regulator with XRE-family HTH domain